MNKCEQYVGVISKDSSGQEPMRRADDEEPIILRFEIVSHRYNELVLSV